LDKLLVTTAVMILMMITGQLKEERQALCYCRPVRLLRLVMRHLMQYKNYTKNKLRIPTRMKLEWKNKKERKKKEARKEEEN